MKWGTATQTTCFFAGESRSSVDIHFGSCPPIKFADSHGFASRAATRLTARALSGPPSSPRPALGPPGVLRPEPRPLDFETVPLADHAPRTSGGGKEASRTHVFCFFRGGGYVVHTVADKTGAKEPVSKFPFQEGTKEIPGVLKATGSVGVSFLEGICLGVMDTILLS